MKKTFFYLFISAFLIIQAHDNDRCFDEDQYLNQSDLDQNIDIEAKRAESAPQQLPIGFIEIKGAVNDPWKHILTLHQFLQNPDIKAILVRLNGYGDALGYGYALFSELSYIKQHKPVVALIDAGCTESCFYAASGATYIVGSPTSIIGGIGTQQNISKYKNPKIKNDGFAADVDITVLTQGKFKALTDPHSPPLTRQEEDLLKELLIDHYNQYCSDIASARNLEIEKQDAWADGRIFSGIRAQQIGLIDLVGSYSAAIDVIKQLLSKRNGTEFGPVVLIDEKKLNAKDPAHRSDGDDDEKSPSDQDEQQNNTDSDE